MSLKAELETWAAALEAYDAQDFEKSLELFSSIADSSKILTNMGLIYATLGEHEAAVEQFIGATQLDQYLAVAYFQCGVSNFLLTRYDLAHKDFDEALLYLRGNQSINYEQLGLKFKLFSAEVLFNKGLAQIYMGRLQEGLMDMEEGRKEKVTDEHNVIDDAMAERGDGYTVFSIPVGVLYRPSESKLKNAKAKDYMGKARLVATSDANEAYTTFTGVTRLKRGTTRNTSSRAQSMYEEEEEGYGSGGDILDDDIIRIRVKVHYQDDVRGMAIDSGMPFDEFVERLTTKFEKSFQDLAIKFKDEDGGKVTLRDEMDYELAVETARESAKGKSEGRLELWCLDK
ncbi:unnamed protein product [Somion occarium]|uniref:PB1 domain-containing protein n=1 Tax=Somion occarium TaxID=3059160 RepID=A0ABP1DTM5_9APHY